MKVGVPKETADGERRVALVPDVIKKMAAKGFEFVVEPGAGADAMLADEKYEDAGATVSDDVWSADVVVKVAAPSDEEIAKLGDSTVLVGFLGPLTNTEGITALADAGATAFAMEAIPRISRAQAMDALSSQSNVAGYKSVLLATEHLGRFLPMMMTAAGTVPPARVLVLGAGVAGLQAIATARRLGAQVTGYDVRAAVAEQVQSLGAAFLELEAGKGAEGEGGYARELTDEEKSAQQAELADKIATFDVVITTALVPGRRAPILVTKHSVENMKAGSVIVDLAGESGGNCELTEPGRGRRQARRDDRLAAEPPGDHARALVDALRAQRAVAARAARRRRGRAEPRLRRRDRQGRLHHARRRGRPRGREEGDRRRAGRRRAAGAVRARAQAGGRGRSRARGRRAEDRGRGPSRRRRDRGRGVAMDLLTEIAILMLAAFVGFQVISKVPNTLHTPLMSGTNAIHGIVVLGGLIAIAEADGFFTKLIIVIAIVFGTINVVGGFLVTDRMLSMFKRKPEPKPEPEPDNA